MKKEEFQKKLGEHIADLRKQKNLSQTDFGYLLDKDRQTINRIEKGRTNITSYMLRLIAEALEIPQWKMMDFE